MNINPISSLPRSLSKETYSLNAVGICLHNNNSQSATVQHSTNDITWTTVKIYTNAKHNAIDYTNLTPVSARYVRVNVSGCGVMLCLNEIELYSTADTFENYAYGVVPFGYTSPANGFWVISAITPLPSGFQSEGALKMSDTQTAAMPTISQTTATATSKTLEFRYRSKAFVPYGARQFHIRSGATTVYHMAVFSDGSIRYYNGSWVVLAAAGTVPADTWTLIKAVVTISPASASVYVNNVSKGTALKENTAPTSMSNFLFGSTETAPVGDEALFDDISFN